MNEGIMAVVTGLLIAALCSVFATIVWLLVRGSRSRVTYSFVGCQFSQLLWIISELMVISAQNEGQLALSYGVGNLGISFVGSCWLLFSVCYMDRELSRGLIAAVLGFSLFIFGAAVTNPLHGLYYPVFGMSGVSHGILFYISQLYIYAVMLTGIWLVCKKCFEIKERSRGQAVLLSFAVGIPLTINLLTLAGVVDAELALTPISFALSGVLVLFATYRFGFLNVNDAAFEDVLGNIEEGVVVFNRRGGISYLSGTAKRQLGLSEKTDFNMLLEIVSRLSGNHTDENFDCAEVHKDGRIYGIRHYLCRDRKGFPVARTVIISDITRYYQLIAKTDELAAASKRLAVEQERNRIAQEVHDTAGHTFTMISSLAKLSAVRLAGFPESPGISELTEFARETEGLARCGLTELRCSINNLREDSFMKTVCGAVKTVTDALREIKTEICIQGEEDERYSFCVQNIYESLRELVSNCVRYSGADRIDIIVKFLDGVLELYFFDNGRGCPEIKPHGGLRGISQRTESLGGTVVFHSGEGIGFSAVLKIPAVKGGKTE